MERVKAKTQACQAARRNLLGSNLAHQGACVSRYEELSRGPEQHGSCRKQNRRTGDAELRIAQTDGSAGHGTIEFQMPVEGNVEKD